MFKGKKCLCKQQKGRAPQPDGKAENSLVGLKYEQKAPRKRQLPTAESHKALRKVPVAERKHRASQRHTWPQGTGGSLQFSHGAALGPSGKDQTNKPSASDVGAKALLFTSSAQLTSLGDRRPLGASAAQTKPWACALGNILAQHHCLQHQEAATLSDRWPCYRSTGRLARPFWGGWRFCEHSSN